MRMASLILGILGALILLGVGLVWTDDADHLKDVEDMASSYHAMVKQLSNAGKAVLAEAQKRDIDEKLDEVRGHAKAAYPMVVCGLIALIASFFVVRSPKIAGVVMAVAVIVPAMLYARSLVVSLVLALAALLALFARPAHVGLKPAVSG